MVPAVHSGGPLSAQGRGSVAHNTIQVHTIPQFMHVTPSTPHTKIFQSMDGRRLPTNCIRQAQLPNPQHPRTLPLLCLSFFFWGGGCREARRTRFNRKFINTNLVVASRP